MSHSRQLPLGANLRQLKNQAKDLCRACGEGDLSAIRRVGQSHPKFSGLTEAEIAEGGIVLADAQLVIARELGFDSWPKLKKHFESVAQPATTMHRLVMEGNLQAMQEAVAQDPESVNKLNESGLPPLYTAALHRNQQAIDFLLEHGAELDILACACLGRAADAEILLKQNPELVRATTRDGVTALHYAARAGHTNIDGDPRRVNDDTAYLSSQCRRNIDGRRRGSGFAKIRHRRPVAVVENGLVRLFDPRVTPPEHSRVIVVASEPA